MDEIARLWNRARDDCSHFYHGLRGNLSQRYANLRDRFNRIRTAYQNRTHVEKFMFWLDRLLLFLLPFILLFGLSQLPPTTPIGNVQTFTLDFTTGYHVIATMANESFAAPLHVKVAYGNRGFFDPRIGDTHHSDLFGNQGTGLSVIRRAPENKNDKPDSSTSSSSPALNGEHVTHLALTPIFPTNTNKFRLMWAWPGYLSSCLLIPNSARGNRLSVRRLLKEGWVIIMKEDDGTIDSGPRTGEHDGKDQSGGYAWDGDYEFVGRAGYGAKVDQGRGSGKQGMDAGMVLRHRKLGWEIRPKWVVVSEGYGEWRVDLMVPDYRPWGNWASRTWARMNH
ncbi:uncharacterized protein KY384_008046 [Bacidia gigantensis]|uniref:uncharacterized protein n=1 Tax=Bacidia gigantensis TaxID=2732470 RepID=UPI001D0400D1|nr:uncharacterized protein KY384_008046 [Bacidia gigantensis]KAG8527302.1 hypothetical protein KY384_008046 [Bacidia gigantensis]